MADPIDGNGIDRRGRRNVQPRLLPGCGALRLLLALLFAVLGFFHPGLLATAGAADAVAVNVVSGVYSPGTRERVFVPARQDWLAEGLSVPGLLDRHRAVKADKPYRYAATPTADGLEGRFSASHIVDLPLPGLEAGAFNVWANGALRIHNRIDDGSGKTSDWGSFLLVSVGSDYLVMPRLSIGSSVHYHRYSDPLDEGSGIRGNGWLAGPNASAELLRNLFLDVDLLYGQTRNEVDTGRATGSFNSSLWVLRGTLRREILFGNKITFTPRLKVSYLDETVAGHDILDGSGNMHEIRGFRAMQLRGSVGFDICREYALANGLALTPGLGFDVGYSGLDGSGYFLLLDPELTLSTREGWTFVGGVQVALSQRGEETFGIRVDISRRF
nr:autotransporter outer membrane beta-barrel domain-containing protein [uncultured Gellertiella sp.]